MIHTRDQLREAACELGLSEVADSITNLALDSLRIRTRPVEDGELPIGASKFGGLPDLPPNVVWPDYINRERGKVRGRRESLGFLAQFNMAELAHHAPEGILPRTGMLYFFCAIWECAIGGDAKGNGGEWHVIYDNSEASALLRTLPPRPLPEDQRDDICGAHAYPFAASSLLFHRELTLPELYTGYTTNLYLHDAESSGYYELRQMLADNSGDKATVHRLMGHAQHKQASGSWEGNLERLLLQIDSDILDERQDAIEWQGGGIGHFWIKPTDLEKHNFSHVSLSMECT